MKKLFLVLVVILLSIPTAFTQTSDTAVEEEKTNFIVFQTDIVSRFIWRGQTMSEMPNIQPALLYTTPKFDVGFLGSASIPYNGIDGENWNEFDIFAEYRPVPELGIRVTDFYFQNLWTPVGVDPNTKDNYFNYGKNTTGHYINLDVLLYFGQKVDDGGVPYNTFTFDASVVLYGNDKNYYYQYIDSPDSLNNAYSSYFDITYNWKNKLTAFAGMTPTAGFYNNQYDEGSNSTNMALVNLGIRYDAAIPITEKFDLPVFATLVTNPNTERVYFVFGITLLSIN